MKTLIGIILLLVLLGACSSSNESNSPDSELWNSDDDSTDRMFIWDDNSISIRIQEFSWLDYDFGVVKSGAERTRDELSENSLQLLYQLHGPVVLSESPRCPDEFMDSPELSIFILLIFQSDGNYRNAGAANMDLCGTNLIGGILLDIESVRNLHTSIGADWQL